MRRKELFAVALSALSLSNKNSREPGATSRATAKKSRAKNLYGRYASCYSSVFGITLLKVEALPMEKPKRIKIMANFL